MPVPEFHNGAPHPLALIFPSPPQGGRAPVVHLPPAPPTGSHAPPPGDRLPVSRPPPVFHLPPVSHEDDGALLNPDPIYSDMPDPDEVSINVGEEPKASDVELVASGREDIASLLALLTNIQTEIASVKASNAIIADSSKITRGRVTTILTLVIIMYFYLLATQTIQMLKKH